MYEDTTETEFVNENEKERVPWSVTNVILKKCGEYYYRLTEAHENYFYYGGTRKKVKVQDGKVETVALGRKSEASGEQQRANVFRVQKRRNEDVRDRMNCNEDDLTVFDTLTGTGDYRDLDVANADRKNYFQRLERFCQTGKLYGKTVKNFTGDPEFSLLALGVIEFQDGSRWKRKGVERPGTGNVHFHHFQNTPYLPQVNVIHANVHDTDGSLKEHYLNFSKEIGFFWSKVADRNTIWFNTEKELVSFLREQKPDFPGLFFQAELKKLCVNALLWEQGHTKIKKLQDLRRHGKCANAGEYLCQYLSEDVDERLKGRHGWYKAGKLKQPEIYRDPIQVDRIIKQMELFKVLTHELHFIAEYIGAMSYYFFNFWMLVFPWIKTMYEKKAKHEKMKPIDWTAAGVGTFQPLLL